MSELSAFHRILNVLEVTPWEFHAAFFYVHLLSQCLDAVVQFLTSVTPVCLFKMAALLESPTFVYNESHFALVLFIALCSLVFFFLIDVGMAIKILHNIGSNGCNIFDKVP